MEKEEKLSKQDLAAAADEWEELMDPLTENMYYWSKLTNEISLKPPKSWVARLELIQEEEQNKKNYEETQKRVAKMRGITNSKAKMGARRR